MAKKFSINEFWHYVFGTLLIIFGGHWISDITGLEQWTIQNNIIGYIVLFIYYLIVYIVIDQSLHKIFRLI